MLTTGSIDCIEANGDTCLPMSVGGALTLS